LKNALACLSACSHCPALNPALKGDCTSLAAWSASRTGTAECSPVNGEASPALVSACIVGMRTPLAA
jgi:hypothetical protein